MTPDERRLATTWRRIAVVPGDDARALGWMIGTARRCLANHRRGSKRRLEATQRLEQTLATAAPPPESDSCLAEAMAELAHAVRKRTQRARDALRERIGSPARG